MRKAAATPPALAKPMVEQAGRQHGKGIVGEDFLYDGLNLPADDDVTGTNDHGRTIMGHALRAYQ